jgi:hypothetical protein
LPETDKVCVILLKNADISVFVVQVYLDLGLPQLEDTSCQSGVDLG